MNNDSNNNNNNNNNNERQYGFLGIGFTFEFTLLLILPRPSFSGCVGMYVLYSVGNRRYGQTLAERLKRGY